MSLCDLSFLNFCGTNSASEPEVVKTYAGQTEYRLKSGASIVIIDDPNRTDTTTEVLETIFTGAKHNCLIGAGSFALIHKLLDARVAEFAEGKGFDLSIHEASKVSFDCTTTNYTFEQGVDFLPLFDCISQKYKIQTITDQDVADAKDALGTETFADPQPQTELVKTWSRGFYHAWKNAFNNHPYRVGSTFPTAIDVANCNKEILSLFYKTFIKPDNSQIIVIGKDLDKDAILGTFSHVFGGFPASENAAPLTQSADFQSLKTVEDMDGSRTVVYETEFANSPFITHFVKIPSIEDGTQYASVEIFVTALAQHVNDSGLFGPGFDWGIVVTRDQGMVALPFTFLPGVSVTPENVADRIAEIKDCISSFELTPAVITVARDYMKTNYYDPTFLDSTTMAFNILYGNWALNFTHNNDLNAASLDSVTQAGAKVLDETKMVTVIGYGTTPASTSSFRFKTKASKTKNQARF